MRLENSSTLEKYSTVLCVSNLVNLHTRRNSHICQPCCTYVPLGPLASSAPPLELAIFLASVCAWSEFRNRKHTEVTRKRELMSTSKSKDLFKRCKHQRVGNSAISNDTVDYATGIVEIFPSAVKRCETLHCMLLAACIGLTGCLYGMTGPVKVVCSAI